jgi:hypothetical protein
MFLVGTSEFSGVAEVFFPAAVGADAREKGRGKREEGIEVLGHCISRYL